MFSTKLLMPGALYGLHWHPRRCLGMDICDRFDFPFLGMRGGPNSTEFGLGSLPRRPKCGDWVLTKAPKGQNLTDSGFLGPLCGPSLQRHTQVERGRVWGQPADPKMTNKMGHKRPPPGDVACKNFEGSKYGLPITEGWAIDSITSLIDFLAKGGDTAATGQRGVVYSTQDWVYQDWAHGVEIWPSDGLMLLLLCQRRPWRQLLLLHPPEHQQQRLRLRRGASCPGCC